MKALIVGLLGLTVLSACATFKPLSTSKLPSAGQGFCNSNNGIFVIWINDEGKQSAFVCPNIKGRPISQVSKLPPDLVKVLTTDLGEAKKLNLPGQPDPCIVWTVEGTRHAFCW